MPGIDQVRAEVADLTGSLLAPLRALLISLVSVWLAWLWLGGAQSEPLIVSSVIILLAYLLDWMGRSCLPLYPRLGLALMELWIFAPLMLGAVAAAATVVLSVKLWVPENAPLERKELIGAMTTGITSFLTAGFISWAGEKDDSRVAKRIQRIFYSKYKRFKIGTTAIDGIKYFKAGSRGERLVYSDEFAGAEGWSREARRLRAREISKELETKLSDPTP